MASFFSRGVRFLRRAYGEVDVLKREPFGSIRFRIRLFVPVISGYVL